MREALHPKRIEGKRSNDYINSPRHSQKEGLTTIQISQSLDIARRIIDRTANGPIIWPCFPRGRLKKEVRECGCGREL